MLGPIHAASNYTSPIRPALLEKNIVVNGIFHNHSFKLWFPILLDLRLGKLPRIYFLDYLLHFDLLLRLLFGVCLLLGLLGLLFVIFMFGLLVLWHSNWFNIKISLAKTASSNNLWMLRAHKFILQKISITIEIQGWFLQPFYYFLNKPHPPSIIWINDIDKDHLHPSCPKVFVQSSYSLSWAWSTEGFVLFNADTKSSFVMIPMSNWLWSLKSSQLLSYPSYPYLQGVYLPLLSFLNFLASWSLRTGS